MSILSIFIQLVHYFFVAFVFLGLKLFGYISFTHMVAAYLIYCIYVQYSSKTKLFYTKNAKNEKILSMCPELSNPNFKPHFFLPFAFQQMILSEIPLLLTNKPKVSFRTQKVNDYGVNLYWSYFTDIKEVSDPNTPILFFCPGMTGEITDPYVINICIEGLKNGYHVCVYQMRILSENFGVDESEE